MGHDAALAQFVSAILKVRVHYVLLKAEDAKIDLRYHFPSRDLHHGLAKYRPDFLYIYAMSVFGRWFDTMNFDAVVFAERLQQRRIDERLIIVANQRKAATYRSAFKSDGNKNQGRQVGLFRAVIFGPTQETQR